MGFGNQCGTRLRGIEIKVMRGLVLIPLAIMFVVIPHYTVRWYADYVGQSVDYRTEGVTDIHHRGRTFTYGRRDVAAAARAMLDDIEEQTEPGDHERFAHYVRKEKIMESALSGKPVIALCGKVWVPGRDPNKFPVCPTCKEIYEGLRDPQDGEGDSGK